MTPFTRKELYLAVLAGLSNEKPTPITREEEYLGLIADRFNSISQEFSEDVFVINYIQEPIDSEESESETTEYTVVCDKTAEEIYEAYTSGKHIVALYEGFVNLTLTFCYKEDNDVVIHWSALFAAGDYSRVGMYRDNIASAGIEHVNEAISIKQETVITRGSLMTWLENHTFSKPTTDLDPESEP